MYIPEFVLGMVVGATISVVGLIVIAIISDKHDKEK